jgi:Tfp pilus assembly protein PilN
MQRWYQISLGAAIITMCLIGILIGTIIFSVNEVAEANKRREQRLLREEQIRAAREKAELDEFEKGYCMGDYFEWR